MELILPPDFKEIFVVASMATQSPASTEQLLELVKEFLDIIKFRYFVEEDKVQRFVYICAVLRKELLKLIFNLPISEGKLQVG